MQERGDEIEVRVVPAATFVQSDVDRLDAELRARLGPAIGIRYVVVDDIAPGPNGKVKFMVSRLPVDPAPRRSAAG